jgi:hypothetical protein
MGFLSKLMKNPLVQMALPAALTYAMGPAGAAMGKWGMFKNMSPLMGNALKQSMLGYGTAALSGSRRPGKAALAAGLTSIPFSYMSAANAANAYNDAYSKTPPMVDGAIGRAPTMGGGSKYPFLSNLGGKQDVMGKVPMKDFSYTKMTPYDIMTKSKEASQRAAAINTTMPSADIFSKPEMSKMRLEDGNILSQATGKYKSDFLPTAVSQGVALHVGRDTPKEEWEAARKRRRQELAWMYGIDEDQIEGEMDNPFYGGAFMNTGGLASLNMDDGGGVNGPGTGTSDSIDARLSDGEFVMTAKAVENLGGGDRMAGARKMYSMMNMLDPESEAMSEVV